jgi:hypothetical protein
MAPVPFVWSDIQNIIQADPCIGPLKLGLSQAFFYLPIGAQANAQPERLPNVMVTGAGK